MDHDYLYIVDLVCAYVAGISSLTRNELATDIWMIIFCQFPRSGNVTLESFLHTTAKAVKISELTAVTAYYSCYFIMISPLFWMKTDANKCTACTICIALLLKDTDCCKQQAGACCS